VDFPVVRPLLPVLPWQPTPAAAPPARIGNAPSSTGWPVPTPFRPAVRPDVPPRTGCVAPGLATMPPVRRNSQALVWTCLVGSCPDRAIGNPDLTP
jgi:hypothetical protein